MSHDPVLPPCQPVAAWTSRTRPRPSFKRRQHHAHAATSPDAQTNILWTRYAHRGRSGQYSEFGCPLGPRWSKEVTVGTRATQQPYSAQSGATKAPQFQPYSAQQHQHNWPCTTRKAAGIATLLLAGASTLTNDVSHRWLAPPPAPQRRCSHAVPLGSEHVRAAVVRRVVGQSNTPAPQHNKTPSAPRRNPTHSTRRSGISSTPRGLQATNTS